MTALPPDDRHGLPPIHSSGATPTDEAFDLLAGVVAFQAAQANHALRRPGPWQPLAGRRWRREHEVLLLQRQVLRLRVESVPMAAYAPFPRPEL